MGTKKSDSKKEHEHDFIVTEFYRSNNRIIGVAILACKCGEEVFEELMFTETED